MRRLLSSLFLMTFFLCGAKAQDYDPLFRKISPDEGFTYGSIKTIAEDANGFIWFGTEHGLYRYNSLEVEKFVHQNDNRNSLPGNNIEDLFKDDQGRLWVAANNTLCYFDERRQHFVKIELAGSQCDDISTTTDKILQNKKGDMYVLLCNQVYRMDFSDSLFQKINIGLNDSSDFITNIEFDNANNMWAGTNHGFVYFITEPYQQFELFFHRVNDRVQAFYQDNNTLWIGYETMGADHVNDLGILIQDYSQYGFDADGQKGNDRVRGIIKDSDNRIWIGSNNGLLLVGRNRTQLIRRDYYNNLPHNSIHSLFKDSKDGIWIGTWSGGLVYLGKDKNHFLHFNHNPGNKPLKSNVVSSFAEDGSGSVWISTEDGGLNYFDRNRKEFDSFAGSIPGSSPGNIKKIFFHGKSRLWLGTYAGGLWSFDIAAKTYMRHPFGGKTNISIYDILAEGNGLWLASFGDGLYYYDPTNGYIKKYESKNNDPYSLSSNLTRTLLLDSYGGLWVGTQNGLNYKPKGSERFNRFFYNQTGIQSISNNQIFTLFEDASGLIWIGTGGGGVNCYDPETGEISIIQPIDGLAGASVYGILEDNKGNLWFSTEKGLSCYSPGSRTFRNFDKEDGLQGRQFNPGAAYKCANGEFLFGGPNGFNLFNPDLITNNPVPPRVFISGLEINNQNVEPGDGHEFVRTAVHMLDELVLKHHQNTLAFEFVANNYIQPNKNRFRYRLVNYQDLWIDAGTTGKAIFTKVPPGKYTFEILGSNNDGIWSEEPTRLSINILFPFWRSNLAYILYVLVLTTAAWFIRREIILRHQLRNQLLIEKVERENEENLHQLKLQIFTNISHEFRTPLTLILSPLEFIMAKKHNDKDTKDHLEMIQRNAHRLRMLINQIIDFRRFELGKIEYNPVQTDLIRLCKEICTHFETHARDKSVSFRMESLFSRLEMKLDPEKLDKVIFNLISNAFKFTPEGGSIQVIVEERDIDPAGHNVFSTDPKLSGKLIAVTVADSGPWIPEEEIPKIFDRFYRSGTGKFQGTGIGLHLCNEYTRLHNGAIAVENLPEKGVAFTVYLPAKPVEMTLATGRKNRKRWEAAREDSITGEVPQVARNDQQYSVLVIEDNLDMQKQIRNLLEKEYKVVVASNGRQGLEMARQIYPDLVLSDVIMPEMDGFELCKRLKEDIHTCHIPVILLTALSETDKQIDGLELGADAYLVKPFDNSLLKAQINNLLSSRVMLQKSFRDSEEKWAGDINLNQRDKNLIDKSVQIIEKHLLDPGFSVEQLSQKLGVSRSSLHRKMKALTNQSATEFIRYVRLRKAVKLMKEGLLNIDEICFAVGFNSHSYFTQSFKRQFGKTPTEHIAELKTQAAED
jgi:signal transduction histidine kinase/ligand-binding sensor domain-containing protein/AraC-like DNA-binding protein